MWPTLSQVWPTLLSVPAKFPKRRRIFRRHFPGVEERRRCLRGAGGNFNNVRGIYWLIDRCRKDRVWKIITPVLKQGAYAPQNAAPFSYPWQRKKERDWGKTIQQLCLSVCWPHFPLFRRERKSGWREKHWAADKRGLASHLLHPLRSIRVWRMAMEHWQKDHSKIEDVPKK